jgi:hypothetical protein
VPVISGGNINPPGPNAGLRTPIFATQGVPTDATIGLPASSIVNGLICQDVTTTFLYERRAGAWVRMDTI